MEKVTTCKYVASQIGVSALLPGGGPGKLASGEHGGGGNTRGNTPPEVIKWAAGGGTLPPPEVKWAARGGSSPEPLERIISG
jgi:hypothetical protein